LGFSRGRPERPRYGWIFILGVVMWTPSFAYLAALQLIAEAQLMPAARLLHLLVVDAVVLLMVELPLLVSSLAPRWSTRQLDLLAERVFRHAGPIALLAAGIGGLYLTLTGIRDLV